MIDRDILANVIASQYDLFANNVNGTYWRTRIKQNTGALVTPSTLQVDLLIGLSALANSVSMQLHTQAMLEAGGRAEIADALQEQADATTHQIESFGVKAVAAAMQLFRSASLQRISSLSDIPSLELRMADSVGRSQDIRRLVWLEARHFAVSMHVIKRVMELRGAGHTTAKLHYPDEHINEGVVVSLDEVETWRQEYFHPNSSAMVVAND